MSSALAIAAVTAVLKNLLDNSLVHHGIASSLGDVAVTALPPDRIETGADEKSQLNLFLYRVTPNSGWRSKGAPMLRGGEGQREKRSDSRDNGDGTGGRQQPPLALDLRYLLTAYGEQDFQSEILLGYGIQTLYRASTLTRDAIRSALAAISGSGSAAVVAPARAALGASDLADSVERIEVSLEFLSSEELSKLWSTLQARYRPSAAYKVSTVLIGADDE
jgi:hypothetical protein